MTCRPTRLPSDALRLFLMILWLAFLPSCRKATPNSEAHEEHTAESASESPQGAEPAHENGEAPAKGETHADAEVHSDTEQARSVSLDGVRGVSFSTVGAPRVEGAWFAAEAIAEPSATTTFSAPVAGIVTALYFEPGRSVARGQAVVEIRSPELAEKKAEWLTARTRLAQATREVEREQRLLDGGATSKRDLEAAQLEAAVAESQEAAARLALEARGVDPASTGATYRVRAPRAGVLDAYAVAVGQGVQAGGDLGRLIERGASRVLVEIPLPGPAAWDQGAETEVRRSDGQRWRATVEGTPAGLSESTRRLAYRLRILGKPSEPLPLAGTPLEVRVPLARAVVLPQTALQQIEGTWGVFVSDGQRASFRPVRKGAELGAEVLILEGVSPDEKIATEGAYLLKSLYLKLAGGGGDEHGH